MLGTMLSKTKIKPEAKARGHFFSSISTEKPLFCSFYKFKLQIRQHLFDHLGLVVR
jgi:hypothetical protein